MKPERHAPPAVAIVIVNWNSWRDTIECLDSLLLHSHDNFHVFVVDNQSGDQSVEHIAAWCGQPAADKQWRVQEGVDRWTDRTPVEAVAYRACDRLSAALEPAPPGCRLTLIRSGGNLGFAGGCNVGIRAAGVDSFDYFWLLNNDTVVHRDALRELVQRSAAAPGLGMIGSTVRYYDNPDVVQALGGASMDPRTLLSSHIGAGCRVEEIATRLSAVEREMVYVFGASMLVSSRFVREVGLMQEDYFLYFEERDWAIRGRGKFGLGYAAASHVFHKSGASSSKVMPAFTARLYYRNRIRFVRRFFPERLAACKRRVAWEFLYYVFKRQWGTAGIVASVLWNARKPLDETG